jgi:CBS domain-containing protein
MEIEQLEIRDFLSQCSPLNKLDSATVDRITHSLEIAYQRRGDTILKPGDRNHYLYLIRSGAVEILDGYDKPYSHLEAGDWFGYRSILRGGKIEMRAKAIEDSLLYLIPQALYLELDQHHTTIKQYFSHKKPERLRSAIADLRDKHQAPLIGAHAIDLIHRQPLQLEQSTSIHEAAKKMKEATVTALLVTHEETLQGIITDRAFCTKLTVNRMSFDQPIRDIMTPDPMTISAETTGSEALLMMARHNIRHLPVTKSGKVLGMLTATDIIRHQSHTPIYLINEIHRAVSIEALVNLSRQIPATLVSMVHNSLRAYDIAHAISSVGEAITQRLLGFAETSLGPPPIPYAWIVAGSLARNEQTIHSDQDNALLLSNEYDKSTHMHYFQALSQSVSRGLNACGYVYCPGEVMATTDKWRQPLSVWRGYFNQWINSPEQKALMYASIFFDLRCIYGDPHLLKTLRQDVLKQSRGNTIFLAHMAHNALQFHPPLGLFRRFVLEKGGVEEKALNMKKRGVVPITDLARVYALASGADALNTQDRLEAAAEAGAISQSGKSDLLDAFEFISIVRLEHQAAQIKQGETADNFVPPEQLSSLERRHLKDAFDVVRTLQSSMSQTFQAGNV